jgi:nicotinate-nucleotide adenylyltransferase
MTRRIGLLGGTFDPIHLGHLDAAAAAFEALHLDRVLLIPSLQPPHRAEPPHASPFHRFAMTALAASTQPYLAASDLELQTAGGPSYTIDTLARLHRLGLAPAELFFITGADAFAEIATWKGYPALLADTNFVVVSRPGWPAATMRERVPELAPRMIDAAAASGVGPAVLLVDRVTHDVSSTAIRRARRDARPLDGLVPPEVERHILRHALYLRDAQPFIAYAEN